MVVHTAKEMANSRFAFTGHSPLFLAHALPCTDGRRWIRPRHPHRQHLVLPGRVWLPARAGAEAAGCAAAAAAARYRRRESRPAGG